MNYKRLAGIIFLIISICILFFLRNYNKSIPEIRIMTYPSLLSPYGAGIEIQKKFENICQCRVKWMKVEDSTLMVQRLKLRSDGLGVDVIFGLDQMTLSIASQVWEWKAISISNRQFISKLKNEASFFNHLGTLSSSSQKELRWAVPISWAPMTFISKNQKRPFSFQSLLAKNLRKKISIPHPQSSTVGLQFYFWLFNHFKKEELFFFLKHFKEQIYTLGHSWSVSYGLFQKSYVDLVFSYQTSLMYHLLEEKKKFFESYFQKGHPFQVEYAVIPDTCRKCHLAEMFIKFLLRTDVQKTLMYKNYMLPVIENVTDGTPFHQLVDLPLISYEKMNEFLSEKEVLLKEWKTILY